MIEDGRIVGAILLGYSQEVAAVRTAINRGFHVGGVMDALRAGRWERAGRAVGRAPAAGGRADRGRLSGGPGRLRSALSKSSEQEFMQ